MGQLMVRVARALGVKQGIVRTDKSRASWLSEMTWQTVTLESLSETIASTINTYIETGADTAT